MIRIHFETHSTSTDNELGIASGHGDPGLSALGKRQAAELGARYREVSIDAVYHSDLQRAVQTGEIAFGSRELPRISDRRLRECDYGELTGAPSGVIARTRHQYVEVPYTSGESYRDVARRVGGFLHDLGVSRYSAVVVIGHRATYYALEHLLVGAALDTVVGSEFHWQPGWPFELA